MRRSVSKVSGTRKKRRSAPKRKTTSRRRRRISGIGSFDLGGVAIKVAGLGAGAIAARELNTLLVKMSPTTFTPMVSGLVQIAGGVFLPMLVKGNAFVNDMGDGMIANGVMVEAVNLGLISGVGGGGKMSYRINGPGNLSAVAGPGRLRAIAGGNGMISTVAGVSRNRKVANRCY
jgi:hypothetical protein